jgi:uncharacterized protein YqgC (DUF456 family)
MDFIAWILLISGIVGAVVPLLPGPLLTAAGLILLAQTHSLSADTGVYFYAWSFVGLLFFLADYLLPGYIAKRGGGSKAASKGATIGILVGLITGPGMFVGAFIGAFIGQYSSNNSVGKSLQSAFLATLGITLGIIGKLIYTLSAVALVLSLASI